MKPRETKSAEKPSVYGGITRALMLKAGGKAWDWYIATGECLFCNAEDDKHEAHCVFSEVNR